MFLSPGMLCTSLSSSSIATWAGSDARWQRSRQLCGKKRMLKTRSRGVLIFVAVVASLSAGAELPTVHEHWESAWSAAMHAPLPFPGLPLSPVFENQTIRMIVRPTIGGKRVRIRFSNACGTNVLAIGAAHIAVARQGAIIVSESDRALTFGGQASVSVP